MLSLGNIVAGNKVAGNTQCMVMMGPATVLPSVCWALGRYIDDE